MKKPNPKVAQRQSRRDTKRLKTQTRAARATRRR